MRYLIFFITVILFFSCRNEKDGSFTIGNDLAQSVNVQFIDAWSGKVLENVNLDPGVQKINITPNQLYSVIIDETDEFLFYPHQTSELKIQKDTIIIDLFNQKVNLHPQWIEYLINTGEDSLFEWGNTIPVEVLRWKEYDKIFIQLVNGVKPKNNHALSGIELLSYPSAFRLIATMVDTSGLWIGNHTDFIIKTLETNGIDEQIANKFLLKVFYPEKNSRMNDSAILYLKKKGKANVAKELRIVFDSINNDAILPVNQSITEICGLDANGEEICVEEKNHWVLIDFWATWCIPCIKQMPLLDSIMGETNRIVCYSVSVDNEYDAAKWRKISSQYPNLKHIRLVESDSVRYKLGVKGLPRMILVDPKGKIFDPYFPHLQNPIALKWLGEICN